MTQVRRFKDCVLQDRIKKDDFDLATDGMHPTSKVYNHFATTILKPNMDRQ